MLCMLEYENGAVGTIYFSTGEAGQRRMEIVGTKGIIQLKQDGTLIFQEFETDLLTHIATHPGMYDSPDITMVEVVMEEGSGIHTEVYENLYAAITTGTPLMSDGHEGRMSLELANAIIYSGHTGQTIDLPLDRGAYSALLAELRAGSA